MRLPTPKLAAPTLITLLALTNAIGCGADGSGDTTGEKTNGSCTSTAVDHTATCPDGACPITADVAIHCTDEEFAALGARVAASPDTTYVSTAGEPTARLFTVDVAGAKLVDELPLHVRSGPMALAVAADGTLHAAGDETLVKTSPASDGSTMRTYSGGLAVAKRSSGAFTRSDVFSTSSEVPLVDLDVAPDGQPSLWFGDDATGVSLSRATPDASGMWGLHDAPLPAGSFWQHFGLATDGAALGFGIVPGATTEQLFVHAGNQDVALGSPRSLQDSVSSPYNHVFPLQVPAHPAAGIASYAAVIQHDDGLRVAWPATPAYAETTLAETAAPGFTCPGAITIQPGDACPGTCHETASGLDLNAFAAARADSGDVWVAYAITHHDDVITYATSCPNGQPEGFCVCNTTVEPKGTTSELFVVRLSLDGQPPKLVAQVPVGPLAKTRTQWNDDQAHVVDARAFGDDLAVAVRVVVDGGSSVRVIRIHGTKV